MPSVLSISTIDRKFAFLVTCLRHFTHAPVVECLRDVNVHGPKYYNHRQMVSLAHDANTTSSWRFTYTPAVERLRDFNALDSKYLNH
ncbi:hypothetical protein AMTR_s00076p00156110 [Amborella trichopoda]|uniref:Uncharacterized protein n=1 Tax=Amborella trichopoda TaxID=13333 RepID=W1PAK2_AMBTC|nr:hypothetical protein AMTR_s00076p00156110 [Amborella trichopoda]